MTMETLTRPAPVEPTTPMKLSEAMRLGCLIAPVQLFEGGYVDESSRAACAFGAAALGFGDSWDAARFRGAYTALLASACVQKCPVNGCPYSYATGIHLNDDHRWSRERIADWLAEQGL